MDHLDPGLADFLFWSSPTPAWIVDAQTELFLAVNDAAIETYGYSRAEFTAMTTCALCVAGGAGEWKNITRDGRVLSVQEVTSGDFFFEGRRARATVSLDISERALLLDAVDNTRLMLAAAERVAVLGTWSADLRARTVEPSAEFRRLFGPTANEIDCHALFLNRLDDDQPRARETLLRAYESLSPFDLECRLHLIDGVRWYHIGLEYARLDLNHRFIGTILDVNDRYTANKRTERIAFVDEPTGLPNRTSLLLHLDAVTLPFGAAIAIVKLYVPEDSTEVYDAAIERLRSTLVEGAYVARYSEHKIVCVFPTRDGASAAGAWARYATSKFDEPLIVGREQVWIRATAATAATADGDCRGKALLSQARETLRVQTPRGSVPTPSRVRSDSRMLE